MRTTTIGAVLAAVLLFGCSQSGDATAASAAQSAEAPDLSAAPSGLYVTDPKHRYITFTYMHQGFARMYLRWRDWEGRLHWDAEDPAASSIEATIDADAIDSGVDEFDDHLRASMFFDTANHPAITFASRKVERTGPATGKIVGDLTIKGSTKPVTLDVTFNKAAAGRDGKSRLGFSAKTMVKRSDFGVDAYVPFVDDEIEVIIEAELIQTEG